MRSYLLQKRLLELIRVLPGIDPNPTRSEPYPENRRERMCLFTGRMHIAAKRPSEPQILRIQNHLFDLVILLRGRTHWRRSSSLMGNQNANESGMLVLRLHQPTLSLLRNISLWACSKLQFTDVFDALKISQVRVYISYNRKQDLAHFRSLLGDVFVDEPPLHGPNTMVDLGITWKV